MKRWPPWSLAAARLFFRGVGSCAELQKMAGYDPIDDSLAAGQAKLADTVPIRSEKARWEFYLSSLIELLLPRDYGSPLYGVEIYRRRKRGRRYLAALLVEFRDGRFCFQDLQEAAEYQAYLEK